MRFANDKQRKAIFANMFSKRKLYHGTSGLRGFAVSREGLIPTSSLPDGRQSAGHLSEPEYVYMTEDPEMARAFAKQTSFHLGGKPYLFEVDAEGLDLEEDPMFGRSYMYKGKIPPERLKEVEFSFWERKRSNWYPVDFNPPENFDDIVRNEVFDIMQSGAFTGKSGELYYDPTDERHISIINGLVNQRLNDIWQPEWGTKPHGRYIKPDVEDALEDLM